MIQRCLYAFFLRYILWCLLGRIQSEGACPTVAVFHFKLLCFLLFKDNSRLEQCTEVTNWCIKYPECGKWSVWRLKFPGGRTPALYVKHKLSNCHFLIVTWQSYTFSQNSVLHFYRRHYKVKAYRFVVTVTAKWAFTGRSQFTLPTAPIHLLSPSICLPIVLLRFRQREPQLK